MSFPVPVKELKPYYLNYYGVIIYLYGKKLTLHGVCVIKYVILNQGIINHFPYFNGKIS
jgi:hypothetical protein